MFERLIQFAIEQRWLVLMAVVGMALLGVYNYGRLPIDAVPDITNVQVQINTSAPGYSPLETEQRITYPIETVMAGLPGLEQTRSLSRYGLSQVTVIFQPRTAPSSATAHPTHQPTCGKSRTGSSSPSLGTSPESPKSTP